VNIFQIRHLTVKQTLGSNHAGCVYYSRK
jgi:hypothetical protein